MIRVLVCDDSDTARRLVVAALRADPPATARALRARLPSPPDG